MAKLSSLNLGDSGPARDQAANRIEAERFVQEIEDMLASGECGFAAETLEGIHATVLESGRVTHGQRMAVANIEHSRQHRPSTHYGRAKVSRRYEGFRR